MVEMGLAVVITVTNSGVDSNGQKRVPKIIDTYEIRPDALLVEKRGLDYYSKVGYGSYIYRPRCPGLSGGKIV